MSSLPEWLRLAAERGGVWVEEDRCFVGRLDPQICNPECSQEDEEG